MPTDSIPRSVNYLDEECTLALQPSALECSVAVLVRPPGHRRDEAVLPAREDLTGLEVGKEVYLANGVARQERALQAPPIGSTYKHLDTAWRTLWRLRSELGLRLIRQLRDLLLSESVGLLRLSLQLLGLALAPLLLLSFPAAYLLLFLPPHRPLLLALAVYAEALLVLRGLLIAEPGAVPVLLLLLRSADGLLHKLLIRVL
mmetsp:Transcript_122615/g.347652  ORF Transcript_122615/g.347652 Transcript_122615/m.347652 type:complete len:202 (+) Transcript_122615:216-821(+)